MSRVSSKVYIIHTLDNDTDTLEEEYDDCIQRWLGHCPINKIQEVIGTQQTIENYMVRELEKLGYKVIKDKSK